METFRLYAESREASLLRHAPDSVCEGNKCDLISHHALWSLLLPLLLLSIMAAIMPGVLFLRSLICLLSFLFSLPHPPSHLSPAVIVAVVAIAAATAQTKQGLLANLPPPPQPKRSMFLTESLLFCANFKLKQTNGKKKKTDAARLPSLNKTVAV